MGAKDVLKALKWIRDNINIFHGDPSKVTVAGAGIGSTIAASLMLSASEDLFIRIIVLSGSALSPSDYRPYTFETERKLYLRLTGSGHKFNRDRFYRILNNASTMELVSASWDLFDSSEVRDRQRLINPFGCVVERSSKQYFMNKSPLKIYEEKTISNIDVMFGYTSLPYLHKLEGLTNNRKLLKYLNYNFQYLLPFEGREDEYNSKIYNRIRKRIMDFYFVNGTIGERSLRRYAKYHSDQVIYPLLRQAALQCESCNNVYLYRFGFKGAFNIGWKSSVPNLNWTGATSGDEICYLFRCKSLNDVYKSVETTDERHFIKNIVRLMANFVKYGNPTPNKQDRILNTLKWEPLLCGQSLKGMSLRKNLKIMKLPEEKRMKFWDHLKREFFSDNVIKDEF
ncbi:acetylcholinesterase-like [Epargyreus clarus]|uniref:acetylcholinesterase-like n=1 Tax=Epargyreus clarus TaxID=520877 RepID=UPI003C30153C